MGLSGPHDRLAAEMKRAGSSGVAAVVDGEVRLAMGDDEPVCVQSVTKLVVSLGAGIALRSLGSPIEAAERPLVDTFPEWAGDARSQISIADLLGHTSGLEPVPPHQLKAADDPVAMALASRHETSQAGRFAYNNAGPILVDEAIRRLTGTAMTDWLDRELFDRLDIAPSWERWSDGTAMTHGGLIASALDLATIAWSAHDSEHDRGPIPAEWVPWMVATGRGAYPQFSWVHLTISNTLIDTWRDAGIDPQLLDQLPDVGTEPVDQGELFAQLPPDLVSELGAAIHGRGLSINDTEVGPPIGWGHDGDGSQWLIVADHPAGIAHTRHADHYGSPPAFFPPRLLLDCL